MAQVIDEDVMKIYFKPSRRKMRQYFGKDTPMPKNKVNLVDEVDN